MFQTEEEQLLETLRVGWRKELAPLVGDINDVNSIQGVRRTHFAATGRRQHADRAEGSARSEVRDFGRIPQLESITGPAWPRGSGNAVY